MEKDNVREKLIRVESFSELRAGLLVVVKPCFCGHTHRGILGRQERGTCVLEVGGRIHVCFPVYPNTRCAELAVVGGRFAINAIAVGDGVVWRVVVDESSAANAHEQEILNVERQAERERIRASNFERWGVR